MSDNALRLAAAELLRLKKLKEWIAANKHNGAVSTADYQAAKDDYEKNKPGAWAALEEALALGPPALPDDSGVIKGRDLFDLTWRGVRSPDDSDDVR